MIARDLAAYRSVPALVTGATGFIGRAVARALAEAGADLYVGARDADAARRLLERLAVGGTPVEAEAGQPDQLRAIIRDIRPAIVFNLAGYGVSTEERDPAAARVVNARFPPAIARVLADVKAPDWPGARLVHAGSALEYGRAGGDLSEETRPEPDTLYGRTKLEGTTGLAAELGRSGLVGLTARLFMVYGPGERAGRLLPSLLACKRSGEALDLSEGLQRRDFTYVGDVAEGLLRLGAGARPGGPRVVNLATGRLTSVRRFVNVAARVLGIQADLLRWGALPTRPEEMRHDPVSIARLERLTAWRPPTDVGEGIRLTVEHEARSV